MYVDEPQHAHLSERSSCTLQRLKESMAPTLPIDIYDIQLIHLLIEHQGRSSVASPGPYRMENISKGGARPSAVPPSCMIEMVHICLVL